MFNFVNIHGIAILFLLQYCYFKMSAQFKNKQLYIFGNKLQFIITFVLTNKNQLYFSQK